MKVDVVCSDPLVKNPKNLTKRELKGSSTNASPCLDHVSTNLTKRELKDVVLQNDFTDFEA